MLSSRTLTLVALLTSAPGAAAQEASQNEANNPLTPKLTINLQNYYVPDVSGLPGNRWANQFLLRGLIPIDISNIPQLFRFTLPIATAPDYNGGYQTGIGDLTLIDLIPMPLGGGRTLAVGPVVVLPTATDDLLGTGKLQLGAAAALIAPQEWGLLGGLVTYQASVAGSSHRPETSLMTIQPIVNYNLSNGFYLRSSAIMSFDFEGDVNYVPVGFGIGKVWKVSDGVTANAFIEPQYTVWREGVGAPEWQIFAGVNFQFSVE